MTYKIIVVTGPPSETPDPKVESRGARTALALNTYSMINSRIFRILYSYYAHE